MTSTKLSKSFSVRLFSSSQVFSKEEDKILADIARRNYAFLKYKKWIHYYEIHKEAMILKDPPQTYYMALIEDNGFRRKALAHCKIAPGGYVTNSIAKNHARNCQHLIDMHSAEDALSILLGSPQGYIQMESIKDSGKEFNYPVIRSDSNIAEIIQFCGEPPFVLPFLLSLYMIADFPWQAIASLGLDGYPYLEDIFRNVAFYGTSVLSISSRLAEVVSVEPLHLGPLLEDFNSKIDPPYRVSFWPPYASCYPWGAIMFMQMSEAMKRELGVDFSNEIQIVGPRGLPIFERGYHEQFCAARLRLAMRYINTLRGLGEEDGRHRFVSTPYRSIMHNQSIC